MRRGVARSARAAAAAVVPTSDEMHTGFLLDLMILAAVIAPVV
jgi:hypothetical protein